MKSRTPANKASGQAIVELAFVLPVLVLLLLGLYDGASAIRANNIISNMSREGANLASRSTIPSQDILNALAMTAQPLDMKKNGMMYITVVQGDATQPMVESQIGWQNSDLRDSISSRVDAQKLGVNLDSSKNQIAYVVEVFYNYKSMFLSETKLLYSKTIF